MIFDRTLFALRPYIVELSWIGYRCGASFLAMLVHPLFEAYRTAIPARHLKMVPGSYDAGFQAAIYVTFVLSTSVINSRDGVGAFSHSWLCGINRRC
jgi:hypothetical protein